MAGWSDPSARASSASALCDGLLRANQQQLRLRDVDIGEAHVQLRSELVLGQFGHLVAQQLARGDGLLRHPDHGLRVQHIEIGAVDLQHDVVARGLSEFCSVACACRRELATRFGVRPESVISWLTLMPWPKRLNRREAGDRPRRCAPVVALRAGDVAVERPDNMAARLIDDLLVGEVDFVLRGLNLRMILDRQRLGVLQA